MLELYFTCDEEARRFCEQLFHYNKHIELQWKTNKDWGNQLQLKQMIHEQTLEYVGQSIVDVFCMYRLTHSIQYIIKNIYYFENSEEIERILELSHWLILSDNEETSFKKQKNPILTLTSIFMENLRHTTSFHYDSIVKFRLKPFKEELVYFVGLAIDEFKREEDHQTFIHMLREYIVHKKARYEEVYVIQGENFTFFKPNGKRFSKLELERFMRNEPLYMVGLDINEWNLAPLVALAPQKINIYGNHPSEPKTLTVINIFQERVTLKSLNQFPFYNYEKK